MGQLKRREHGVGITSSIEADGETHVPTLQCVHCGDHWFSVPGSGKIRGWCMRCNGPVCGKKCEVCIPFEKQLEVREAGGNWGEDLPNKPVSVPTPSKKLWLPDDV